MHFDQKTSFDKNQIRVIINYLVITVLYKSTKVELKPQKKKTNFTEKHYMV